MVTSRDDLSIAIRSAFLKKGTKQKFSLLALIVASFFLIFLESINWKPLNLVRSVVKDVIYRTSFITSIPGNLASSLIVNFEDHFVWLLFVVVCYLHIKLFKLNFFLKFSTNGIYKKHST